MSIKNNKGVTIVALILTIVLMLVLVGVSLSTGYSVTKSMRASRIISYMKLIQAKVAIINENYSSYGYDTDYLNGDGPYKIGEIEGIDISKSEINLIAENAGVSNEDAQNWNWYKWDIDDLIEQNLDRNMLGDDEYYYVNYEYGEIIYSKGTANNGVNYYSMTGLNKSL